MMRHHKEIWLTVLAIFRQRQPSEGVELLIGVLEGQLARGEFDPGLPETKAIVEAILRAVCPDRGYVPAGKEG